MKVSRDLIMQALLAKIVAGGYFAATGRRLKIWTEVAIQPACFLYEHGEMRTHQSSNLPKDGLNVDIYVYVKTGDPNAVPATLLDNALDAIDAALAPTGADKIRNRQTLGGLVEHCFVDGRVVKDPGDLDGQGVAVVPIVILVP
jgi:hypothetical protein